MLVRYQGLLRRTLNHHGGTVEKFIGDAVVAVFGAPISHEDDPERAVKAALAIQQAMQELRESDPRLDLRVRIGVNTGEAAVAVDAATRSGEGIVFGDTVNVAARLQAVAPVDGVLVGEATHRATRRAIEYRAVDPVHAKGKALPVVAWVALGEASSTDPPLPPQVGREDELEQVWAALARVRAQHRPQLVTISGAPGMGKSRLVSELRARGDPAGEVIWRRGRSLAYGEGIAFWALGEIVKDQAGILESDDVATAERKLDRSTAELIGEERDRAWVARHLRGLVGLSGPAVEGGRGEAFEAWRRFFAGLADARPAVLVFEDLHWADDALLDFVELLAGDPRSGRLLIVVTARPEFLDRRTLQSGSAEPTAIRLRPLSVENTARLLDDLLDQATLPDDVQRALLERVEGNPLFAQEYVRMLQDRGLLVVRERVWTLTGPIEGLPESIQSILAARLDMLSLDEKQLVHDASVVGRYAWLGAVCALSNRTPASAMELLRSLERKQLLERVRRSSIARETEFRFGHELTRDVAYSQIARADRARKHEAAAAWIEHLAGGRDDKAELLADHYQHALRLRETLGEDTTALARRARVALRDAAQHAAAVYAHAAAARHFLSALALGAADDPERPELLLGASVELFEAGQADAGTLEEALQSQVSAGRWESAARIERMLFFWYQERAGRGIAADAHLARGADYAARVPPSEVMCQIASDQALRLAVSGRAREAFELTDQLIPIAEGADLPVGRALLLQWRGSARVMLGDPDGVEDMRRAADTLAAHEHPVTPGAYGNLAEPLRDLGDLAAADAVYATAHRWATRLASAMYLDWIVAMQAYQAYHAGDWEAARGLLAQIDTTNRYDNVEADVTRGRLQLGTGCTAEALDTANGIVEYATGIGNDQLLYSGLALAARAMHASGRPDAAAATWRRFLDRWHESGGTIGGAIELCEIAHLLALAGEQRAIAEAARLLPDASRWKAALLAIADGRLSEAVTAYEDAGSRPLAASACLFKMRAAREHDQPSSARDASAVRAFAERAGATMYLDELAALNVNPVA